MRPPQEINEKLKTFASELRIQWDEKSQRWQVWSYPNNLSPYRVINVQNPDGSFRKPDNRIFSQLAFSDRYRYASTAHQLSAIDNSFRQIKAEEERVFSEQREEMLDKVQDSMKRDFHGHTSHGNVPRKSERY